MIAGEYLRKGSQCYVEGRITYSEHTGDDGQKRYYTDIIADEMQMLGGRSEGGGGGGGGYERSSGGGSGGDRGARAQPAQRREPQKQAPAQPADFGDTGFDDDDIPF